MVSPGNIYTSIKASTKNLTRIYITHIIIIKGKRPEFERGREGNMGEVRGRRVIYFTFKKVKKTRKYPSMNQEVSCHQTVNLLAA